MKKVDFFGGFIFGVFWVIRRKHLGETINYHSWLIGWLAAGAIMLSIILTVSAL